MAAITEEEKRQIKVLEKKILKKMKKEMSTASRQGLEKIKIWYRKYQQTSTDLLKLIT